MSKTLTSNLMKGEDDRAVIRVAFSRCLTTASGYKAIQLELINTLSILSWIRPVRGLRLDQVYQGLENPISIILHLSGHS